MLAHILANTPVSHALALGPFYRGGREVKSITQPGRNRAGIYKQAVGGPELICFLLVIYHPSAKCLGTGAWHQPINQGKQPQRGEEAFPSAGAGCTGSTERDSWDPFTCCPLASWDPAYFAPPAVRDPIISELFLTCLGKPLPPDSTGPQKHPSWLLLPFQV